MMAAHAHADQLQFRTNLHGDPSQREVASRVRIVDSSRFIQAAIGRLLSVTKGSSRPRADVQINAPKPSFKMVAGTSYSVYGALANRVERMVVQQQARLIL